MAIATRYIEGAAVSSRAGQGVQFTEPWYVTEATGNTPIERLNDALTATGLPTLYDPHPTISGVFAQEIRAAPMGTKSDKIDLTVVWSNPELTTVEPDPVVDPGTIYTSAGLQEVETRFDKDGVQITLTRTVGADTETQTGIATLQIPVIIYGVQRRETGNPSLKARANIGRVNSLPIWGEDARRWLCTRLDGTSTDFGSTYTVNYEFQRSELLRYSPTDTYSSWDALLVFEDDEGRPIENPVFGESMKTVQIAGEVDFNTLGLPLV